MTRVLDIRLPSSGRFDTIRWAEYAVLLVAAAGALFFYQPYGTLVVGPLALLSLMLIPGKRQPVSREQERLDNLRDLQQAGLTLREKYRSLSEEPASVEDALSQQDARREIRRWMKACDDGLSRFPELAGIFAARVPVDGEDLVEDLDVCLSMLSRLRRLLSLSERLNLPI